MKVYGLLVLASVSLDLGCAKEEEPTHTGGGEEATHSLDAGASRQGDQESPLGSGRAASPALDAAASRGSLGEATLDAPARPDAGADGGSLPDAAIDSCALGAQMPSALGLRGDLGVHDPAIIESEGQYYLFQTGRGIPTKRSSDLTEWQRGSAVFMQNPPWIAAQVPGVTDLWAPDISAFGGVYHLYYSASTFGSNRSCIGHATRTSLSSGRWEDRGPVVCSNVGGERHDWNAIDPNVVLDESGTPWLSFGSFWSGIKLVKLTLQGERADATLHALASRPGGGALEAPFIVHRCGEYYLFVSFDTCCKGADSTYRIMVGRARAITGPYLDRAGMALTRGGGTLVLEGDARWRGPGHNAVLLTPRGDYNVYHAYAASDGHSELRISKLAWDGEGWPLSAGP